MNAKPISVPDQSGCGVVFLRLFGFAFFSIGMVVFYLTFVSQVWQWYASQSWPSVQGKIKNSRVATHRGEDSTKYSAEFEYEYRVLGKDYTNNRYSVFDYKGSRSSANSSIFRNPIGSETVVFYAPGAPENSVMNRDFKYSVFNGLLSLIFVIAGAAILAGSFFWGWGKDKRKDLSGYSNVVAAPDAAESQSSIAEPVETQLRDDIQDQQFAGPLKLKPDVSKLGMLVGVSIACLFWNGIVSVFAYHIVKDGFPIFESLFITPFALVGLGLVIAVVYCLLAFFNPKIEIALSNGAIPVGCEFDLAWEVTGNVTRFRKLKIWIEGQELASYMQGTDRRTATEVFQVINVTEVTKQTDIQFGSVTIAIPKLTAPSFKSDNNEIKWMVKLHGDIPWWPDVNSTLEFRVKP